MCDWVWWNEWFSSFLLEELRGVFLLYVIMYNKRPLCTSYWSILTTGQAKLDQIKIIEFKDQIQFGFSLIPEIDFTNLKLLAWTFSLSVASNSLQPHGLWLARLLSPWSSPGKNTGVGNHFRLQGIFPTQGSTWLSCIAGRFFSFWATMEACGAA